jgi:parallel beta-helix repeat protein
VNNVSNLNAWQLALKYNGTIINCAAAWTPENGVFGNQATIPVAPILNSPTTDGYNYTLYGEALLAGSVNASQGTLCDLNFTCLAYGTTPLQIGTAANPIETGNIYFKGSIQYFYSYLLDPDQNEMPFTPQDGLETNVPQTILTITPAPNGTTDPPPGEYPVTYGADFSVKAIPNSGYAVCQWLLDGTNVGSANPISVLMTTNHTLQPTFTQANYTLTIFEATGGNTSPPPGTYAYMAGQTVQVSATANNGYVFSYWVLDSSEAGSNNPLAVLMQGNHTLTPIFSQAGYFYIYIRADGSIDPQGAPLSTSNNITYTLAADVNSTITVQRSDILIDGNGHLLQGTGSAEGIRLIGVNNVSVTNISIRGFDDGIDLFDTAFNTVSESNITANDGIGISLYGSSNNTISRNVIFANKGEGIHLDYLSNFNTITENSIGANNYTGIYIDSSSENLVYHNNMLNNTSQVHVAANGYSPSNSWDNGLEGNYWSDYAGLDSDLDGIGDTPYFIATNNTDRFPLMGPFSSFSLPQGSCVNIISNSTITDFKYQSSDRKISFNTEGEQGTTGFCELTIPYTAMDVGRIEVVIDNGDTPILYSNLTLRDNISDRWIFFSYQQSSHSILIQEDWTPPTFVILSPDNKTYSVNKISLNFTVNKQTSWEGYSLDDSANVTITGNETLSTVPDGQHSLVVYGNDTVGNMGASDTLFFMVDTTPPRIIQVVQNPPLNGVPPGETVMINATIIDTASGVKDVNLTYNYTNGNGTYARTVSMANVQGNFWGATIPAFSNGTNVTYTIRAEDNAGNAITTQEMGLNYQYTVMQEYSALFALLLFIVGSLLMALLVKRKNGNRKM